MFENINLLQLGAVGLLTLGAVKSFDIFAEWKNYSLGSEQKWLLALLFAFLFGFIPAEFGNFFLDKAKDAVQIAVAVTGVFKLIEKAKS